MSSCFGFRKSRRSDDHEPLLPQYRDDTVLQRELHKKLHSYQMIRALSKGFMPSTEQAIINLRTLLAADIFNPSSEVELSESGRLLMKNAKKWLQQFIDLLQHKNGEDQIQDLIWYLSKARVSIDTNDIAQRASKAKAKADTTAAYQSLQTVGSLLLTNSDFRLFIQDLNLVGREVFKDTAFALSEVAEAAGKQLEPSAEEKKKLTGPGADDGPKPSTDELTEDAVNATQVIASGAVQVVQEARDSLLDKLSGSEKETLINRLKQAIIKLRQRKDYSESVSTLSQLIKRYAYVYSRAVQETIDTVEVDVNQNAATDRAVKNFYALIKSFGEEAEWDKLEDTWHQVLAHKDNDPEFENLMTETGNSLQALLTDPDFLDRASEKFDELREKSQDIGTESSLRKDIDSFLAQLYVTIQKALADTDVSQLITTTRRILSILSPAGAYINGNLLADSVDVFVPLLIQGIQYIPIPRLEVSTPEADLLLENLIIEPGRTINMSSFFPYKFRAETYNDFEIRKARLRTTSTAKSTVTLKFDGISVRADEVGFWLRTHAGLLRLADEGIASFELDDRGIDIHLDIELGKERLEKILTLKDVRVHIHHLSYTLRKSRFAFISWLFKPLLRPVLRKIMERQLATAIAEMFHSANRELLYARERLRATRIADPDDLITFFKAIAARLTPEEDPDVYTRLGVDEPRTGVFKGVYTPGSIVKLWNEEAVEASERIEDGEGQGWRNEIFDVHAALMT